MLNELQQLLIAGDPEATRAYEAVQDMAENDPVPHLREKAQLTLRNIERSGRARLARGFAATQCRPGQALRGGPQEVGVTGRRAMKRYDTRCLPSILLLSPPAAMAVSRASRPSRPSPHPPWLSR